MKGIPLGSHIPESACRGEVCDYTNAGWRCFRRQPRDAVDHYEWLPIYRILAPESCIQTTTLGLRDASLTLIGLDNGAVGEIDVLFARVIIDDQDFLELRDDLEKKFGPPTFVTQIARQAEWRSTDGSVLKLTRADDGEVFIRMSSAQGLADAVHRKQQADQQRQADY